MMNGGGGKEPVQALLDAEGRIIRADPALQRLQAEAGGRPDGPIALLPIASLVRLAQRLRIPISRAVELPMDARDISLWVQLRPDGDGFVLSLVDWQERHPRDLPGGEAGPDQSAPQPETGWPWQTDVRLRFRGTEPDAEALGHEAPRAGQPLTAYFELDGGEDAADAGMPLLEALAMRLPFRGQQVRLRADRTIRYILSGAPLFDTSGALMGYRGHAGQVAPAPGDLPVEVSGPVPPSVAAGSILGPELARRLDQALRQPIGRIIANASTISSQLEGPLRQEYADYASDIAVAGRHLLELIDDLADLQAIERAGFTTAREEVDLADLGRRAAGLLSVRASARRIRIQTPALGESVPARAEYRRVLQILVNLIANAVRHSPEDSTIWVRVDEEDGVARIVVADQGMGIDPVDHERIFERFERLGLSGDGGSGLGLYISRKLARAMDGELGVDSAPGQGARFTLELPLWNAT